MKYLFIITGRPLNRLVGPFYYMRTIKLRHTTTIYTINRKQFNIPKAFITRAQSKHDIITTGEH